MLQAPQHIDASAGGHSLERTIYLGIALPVYTAGKAIISGMNQTASKCSNRKNPTAMSFQERQRVIEHGWLALGLPHRPVLDSIRFVRLTGGGYFVAPQREKRGRADVRAGRLGLRPWLGRLSEGGRRLRSKRREVGFGYTVKLVWLRLVPRSLFGFDHYNIYGLDLRGWTGRDGDFGEVRWARSDDFEGFLRTGMGPDQAKDLSDESYRAAVIEREERIVAYNWCHTGTAAPWPWMRLSLGPGDVYSFRGWTAPELRGQGLFPRVKGFMARSYTDQGFTRMVSMIEALNRNQQKANARLGGRPIGRLFTLRILRLTLVRLNGTLRVGWWSATQPFTLAIDCVGRAPRDP